MPDGGVVVWLVSVAAGATAFETIRRKILRPLWRWYRWLRHEVREEIERRQKIDALLSRELTHNGGESMKDHTALSARAIQSMRQDIEDVKGSQETIFELLDNIVTTKGNEHDEMWEALRSVGVDRRHFVRRSTDPDQRRQP